MAPKTVFITGANRGIGLGLVKELLKLTEVEILVASARNLDSANALQDIAKKDSRVQLIQLDVSNDESIKNAAHFVHNAVSTKGLNLLINNAGVIETYGSTVPPNRKPVLDCINVNAVSALLLSQHLIPTLQIAAKNHAGSAEDLSIDRAAILNIGSDCASQTLNQRGSLASNSLLAYKMSKVAMLSFAKSMAADFKREEIPILVTTVHPGWVQTDMGGTGAEITIDESVSKIVGGLPSLNSTHAGGLFNRNYETMPF